jgi:Pathogenicity locus
VTSTTRTLTRQHIKAPKAGCAAQCNVLEQLPNIGPSLAADLRLIGIQHPQDLIGQDGYLLYRRLCEVTRVRHDPCVLDTFLAATDFMQGAPATPWWQYTQQRKQLYGAI